MADDQWITVSDASDRLGIPVETIRRYIRQHGHHLKIRKYHKRYQIHDDCLDVIRMIRDAYAKGQSQDEVDRSLVDKGIQTTITVDARTVADDDRMDAVLDRLDKQAEFNQALIRQMADMTEHIQAQNEFIKQLVAEREQQETPEQITHDQDQAEIAQNRSFWARLFKR